MSITKFYLDKFNLDKYINFIYKFKILLIIVN